MARVALSDLGAAQARTPELAARLALAELMLSGCTTAADHHYLFPQGLEEAVDIEVAAAREMGVRMTVTRGSMNLSQKDGGLPPDSVVQDEDAILADSERVLQLFHDPEARRARSASRSPRVRPSRSTSGSCAKAPRLPSATIAGCIRTSAETVGRGSLLSGGLWAAPRRPSRGNRLADARTWLAHGIHFNAEEIAPSWRARASASAIARPPTWCWAPGSADLRARARGRRGGPRRRRLGLQRLAPT